MVDLQRWLQVPGVRRGALVHVAVFVGLAAVWCALEPRPGGTRSADTGAMGLLAPSAVVAGTVVGVMESQRVVFNPASSKTGTSLARVGENQRPHTEYPGPPHAHHQRIPPAR